MTFSLKDIVPWGRSYREYVSMFSLTEDELSRPILGCGDGPASFNATHTKNGGGIVSIDPLYQFSGEEIRKRIEETYDTVMDQTRKNAHEFVWTNIPSVDALGRLRMQAMEEFLLDYPDGLYAGRYVAESLPSLSFPDQIFGLALCSHLLFLYSDHLSLEFHLKSLLELCRVAETVRIFPVLELGAKRSRHLDPIMEKLQSEGKFVRITTVPYTFQKGGGQMLEVRNSY